MSTPHTPRSGDAERSGADPEGLESRRLRNVVYGRVFGDDAEPLRIDRYTVLKRVGQGGMGIVYAAYDTDLDRKVAVKLLHRAGADEADWRGRLRREAQALARLSHPNVVAVYDVDEFDDQLFLAMEFVEGATIRKWLSESTRSWRDVLGVYLQAGRGLAAAHAADIVHRDFKPDNVLMGADGRARVADFGLARAGNEAEDVVPPAGDDSAPVLLTSRLTPSEGILGTPAYMAPEQHRGEAIDARVDQFSFCVSLYEGLYGERPFAGSSRVDLRVAAESGVLRPPPRRSPVPSRLRRVLQRGLSPDADDRYPSMRALLDALEHDPAVLLRRVAIAAIAVPALLFAVGAWRDREAAHAEREQQLLVDKRAEQQKAEESKRREQLERDKLTLESVQADLARDPTLAVARLRGLAPTSREWNGAARTLASHAVHLGVADRVTTLSDDEVAAALAPDGKYVVVRKPSSGAADLLDLDTGARSPLALSAASAPLIAFSPSGARLAVQEEDRVRIVERKTGAQRELGRGSTRHRGIAFTPGGAWVVTWGADEDVRLFAVEGTAEPMVFGGHAAPVSAVRVAQTGSSGVAIATVDAAGTVRHFDTSAGGPRILDGSGPIAMSARGTLVAVNANVQGVRVHDLRGGAVRTLGGIDGPVSALAFAPDGSRVAVGTERGTLSLHPLGAGSGKRRRGHDGAVTEVAFAGAGRVISRSTDHSLGVWTVDTGAFRRLRGHRELAFWTARDATRVVTVGWEGSIRTWAAPKAPLQPIVIHDAPRAVAFAERGAWAVVDASGAVAGGVLGDADIETPSSDAPVTAIVADGDRRSFLLGDAAGVVRRWAPPSAAPTVVAQTQSPIAELTALDGGRIAVVGEGRLAIVDPVSGAREAVDIGTLVPRAVAERDGALRVVGTAGERIELREVGTGLLGAVDGEQVTTARFNADGSVLVVAGFSWGVLYLWDERERRLHKLGAHGDQVSALDVADDGTVVVAAGSNGVIRIWDVDSGGSRAIAVGAPVTAVGFGAQDGDWIAIGTDAELRFARDDAPRVAADLRAWVAALTDYDVPALPERVVYAGPEPRTREGP